MKNFIILASCILVIAAALFYDQVLAVFSGMTTLEALKFIATFILHVVTTTICGYIFIALPEIIKPWLRMHKKTSKAKTRLPLQIKTSKPKRMSTNQILQTLLAKQIGLDTHRSNVTTTASPEEHQIKLDF